MKHNQQICYDSLRVLVRATFNVVKFSSSSCKFMAKTFSSNPIRRIQRRMSLDVKIFPLPDEVTTISGADYSRRFSLSDTSSVDIPILSSHSTSIPSQRSSSVVMGAKWSSNDETDNDSFIPSLDSRCSVTSSSTSSLPSKSESSRIEEVAKHRPIDKPSALSKLMSFYYIANGQYRNYKCSRRKSIIADRYALNETTTPNPAIISPGLNIEQGEPAASEQIPNVVVSRLLDSIGLSCINQDPSLVRHYTEREWQLLIRNRLACLAEP